MRWRGCINAGMTKMAEYEHKLFIDSVTDPLTGLLNRRYFNELSEKEAARSRRQCFHQCASGSRVRV